jgi:hypothetical protein
MLMKSSGFFAEQIIDFYVKKIDGLLVEKVMSRFQKYALHTEI